MKMFSKKSLRIVSLVLTLVMALTMFTGVFTVSAEETTEETVSIYDRFTWSPTKYLTVTNGTTPETEVTTMENVSLAEAQSLAAITGNATKTIETVDNGDGTVTAYKVVTTYTYVANDDGETATVTKTKSVSETPQIFSNPAEMNNNFKLGIYSDRVNARGLYYAHDFEAWQVNTYGNYALGISSANDKHASNDAHKIVLDADVNSNISKSYYSTMTQVAAMKNSLIYVARQYNEMYLEFTAPEDGIYTASGIISKTYNSGSEAEDAIKFYLAKVDVNGIEHAISEKANVPEHSTATADIPNAKVALKAGEKLVLRTDNDLTQIARVFVENYLVTKWGYAEADDNTTVTTNYSYQNHNFMNVYGANYTYSDSNYKTLWSAVAARYSTAADTLDQLDATTPTYAFCSTKASYRSNTNLKKFFVNGKSFARSATSGQSTSGIIHNTETGALTASVGAYTVSSVNYKFGVQFKFTVPESGKVVLTGASATNKGNYISRIGIKKNGSDEIVYDSAYNQDGGFYAYSSDEGVAWDYCRFNTPTAYQTHIIGNLEAGDIIYYELSTPLTGDITSKDDIDLSTLSVAITTENSAADINGDFKGDASDVAYLRKFLLGSFTVNDDTIFNINADEKSDLRDLVAIKKIVVDVAGSESTIDEASYKPTSLTVTLYDSQESVYGFTFNTTEEPLKPVIQIKKLGSDNWSEYDFSSTKASSYTRDGSTITYYISKTEVSLEPNSTYVYRVVDIDASTYFDKYIGTDEVTFETKDPTAESFTFTHVSDTQNGPTYFSQVLSSVTDKSDFLLHTGDVVEYSKYEEEWTAMLDGNFEYLSRVPMMAISGNHETTYRNGSYETYKHFHNSIPEQNSTAKGYFYSFVYGDVKFIMLNTNDLTSNQLKAEQYNWLINELETNTCKWTVVSLHNPLYSVGQYGVTKNTIALALQNQLTSIFAEYGVDIVLQAHDHTVSRTFPLNASGTPQEETFETVNGVEYSINPAGVIYVMNGTSGSQTRNPVSIDESLYSYATGSQKASWAEFKVDGDMLSVAVKYHDGVNEQVYYEWGIKKTSE